MANIKASTLKQLKSVGINAVLKTDTSLYTNEIVTVKNATIMSFGFDDNDDWTGDPIKLPKKKEVTFQWIMNKLNNDKVYESLAGLFEKVVGRGGGISIYGATYGIGFCNFMGKDEKRTARLSEILTDNNIAFRNEYSDASYVYRFVISKSQKNVKAINAMLANDDLLLKKCK